MQFLPAKQTPAKAALFALVLLSSPVALAGGTPAIQTSPDFSWLPLLAALVGFFLGSAGSGGGKIDVQAASILACALGFLSAALCQTHAGDTTSTAVAGYIVGTFCLIGYILFTRDVGGPIARLCPGLNLATGKSARARRRAAEQLFCNAHFGNPHGGSPASRGRTYRFDRGGAPPAHLRYLQEGIAEAANHRLFQHLVILVERLPDKPDEQGVFAVVGYDKLRQMRIENDGIQIVGYPHKISASSIRGLVGYGYR